MRKLTKIISVTIIVAIITACPFVIDDDIDPEQKNKRDAFYTVVEAHAFKQDWMYNYFELFSGNYQQGLMFEYEPQQKEYEEFWNEFALLMKYKEPVNDANDLIEQSTESAMSTFDNHRLKSIQVLVNSMTDFFAWGNDVEEVARQRILSIIEQQLSVEKSQLFNQMLRSVWKNQFSNEQDFWIKLKNGELDNKAFQIYLDFFYGSLNSTNSFAQIAETNGLTPGNITAKVGAEGMAKGSEVYVQSTRTVSLQNKTLKVAQSTINFQNNIEKAFNKSADQIAQVLQNKLIDKMAGVNDVDGVQNYNELILSAGAACEMLLEAAPLSSNPTATNDIGQNWGIKKIKSSNDNFAPEVIVAKIKNKTQINPKYILGVGNFVNTQGETLFGLTKGNWDVTAIDKKGNVAAKPDIEVIAGQIDELILDNVNILPNNNDNVDNNKILDDYLKFSDFEIEFRPDIIIPDLNNLDLIFPGSIESNMEKGKIIWKENYHFESVWEKDSVYDSKTKQLTQKFIIKGSLVLAGDIPLLVLTINTDHYWNNHSYHILKQTWTLEIFGITHSESEKQIFEIKYDSGNDYFNEIEVYVSYVFINDYTSERSGRTYIKRENEYGNDPSFVFKFK